LCFAAVRSREPSARPRGLQRRAAASLVPWATLTARAAPQVAPRRPQAAEMQASTRQPLDVRRRRVHVQGRAQHARIM